MCAHDMGTEVARLADPALWKNSIGKSTREFISSCMHKPVYINVTHMRKLCRITHNLLINLNDTTERVGAAKFTSRLWVVLQVFSRACHVTLYTYAGMCMYAGKVCAVGYSLCLSPLSLYIYPCYRCSQHGRCLRAQLYSPQRHLCPAPPWAGQGGLGSRGTGRSHV